MSAIVIKTAEQIEGIRKSAKLAAETLKYLEQFVVPGMKTIDIDKKCEEFVRDNGAVPATKGYRGFKHSCCISPNEVICHGIPDDTVMEDGDIVNVDISAYLDGVHGDTNGTVIVGQADSEVELLVERTKEAMMRGIRAAKPGREVNIIGRAIETYAKRFNYGVVRDFTGHGVGTSFHSGLIIPHYDEPAYRDIIEPGMVFTVEPMLTLGSQDWDMWNDDWTVTTKDKSFTAQFEHTVLITESGAEILTEA
jgi:methionyl aminopeptidase